jgi:hypothetical protein
MQDDMRLSLPGLSRGGFLLVTGQGMIAWTQILIPTNSFTITGSISCRSSGALVCALTTL